MRNVIKTAATIRNVFAFGQDAAFASTNDKRYGTRRSYLNWASHSSPAHTAGAECRRGLVRWLKTAAARLSVAADAVGLAIMGMAMRRQPVAPRGIGRLTVR
jgi:stage V sporulation protein SpoVS